jgi:NADPH:quinone reductase-like Zn-dependent oxidoreductase
MQAMIHRRYGGPEVMELAEVERPAVADDAVLVRVRGASVNALDWHMLRGEPYLARTEGLRRPKDPAMGVDAAGIVEAVGKDVTWTRPGESVFGARNGAFAEYVAGRSFAPMPPNLTFEQAAAIPVAGMTALQAVRDKAKIRPGQRVLVTGAGGGVGTFAVQIACAHGGIVTAMTSPSKVERVQAMGRARVIDHSREDVTRGTERFDVILDAGGYRRLRDLRHALTPDGTLVLIGPGAGNWTGPITHVASAVVRSRLGKQRFVPFLSHTERDDLLVLGEMVEAGRLFPVIDRAFPFAELPDAIRYLESGAATGKIVITM